MGKTLDIYRAYTSAAMKSRASIPSAASIADNTINIECTNILLSAVKAILGSINSSIATLCADANLNHWSAFGPTQRTVVAGILVNSNPTQNFSLGSFAGYNHNAVAPHFDIGGVHEDEWVIPADEVVFHCKVDIGEILYTDILGRENDAKGVAYSVWDGSTLIDSRVKALAGLTNIADFDYEPADRITLSGISATKEYTQKIEIIDSATTYDYQYSHVICRVPGLESWVKHVHVLAGNFVDQSDLAPGWTFVGTAPNFNSAGHLVFEALVHDGGATQVDHVEITACVEAWDGVTATRITSVHTLYHGGPMSALEYVNVHLWETAEGAEDLPLTGIVLGQYPSLALGYGYRVKVFINEHPA